MQGKDLQPKLQALRKHAEEIRHKIQAEDAAAYVLRVGQLVSATSLRGAPIWQYLSREAPCIEAHAEEAPRPWKLV